MIVASIIFVSVLCILIDTLLGVIRGRNRSFLRLGLVVASALVSLLIYRPITNAIMNVQFDGYSISTTVIEALTNSATSIPETILNLIIALAQIIIGVIVFIGVFSLIKFLTWLVVFPICKIFVRPEEKKNRGLGALIGAVQGLFVAVVICGCLSGFIVEGTRIAQMEVGGEKFVELPEKAGVEGYATSPVAKFFDVTGGWVFDIVSTTTDASGMKVSISSISDAAAAIVNVSTEIADAFTTLENTDTSSPESMKEIGNAFITVGTAIEELDDESKQLVTELIDGAKDMVVSEFGELPPEFEAVFDSIDVEEIKIKSAGEALNALAKYAEDGTVTQDDIDDIVSGIADNMFIIDMFATSGETLLEVSDADVQMFETAIANANLTQEDITTLKTLFGLN